MVADELSESAGTRRDNFCLLLCIERRVLAKVHTGSPRAVRERQRSPKTPLCLPEAALAAELRAKHHSLSAIGISGVRK